MHIYAHRTSRGLAPENTIEGCASSLQFDIDFIDFDIGMTSDGELVATHDPMLNPDLTRAPNGQFITDEISVRELSYEKLAAYNVGQINPASPYATYFPSQRSLPFAKIPRLKEAIHYVQQASRGRVGFQIEIKTDPTESDLTHSPEEFATALHTLIQEMGIQTMTEVQAFDYRCLLALQALDPHIKTAYLSRPLQCDDPSSLESWLAGYDLKAFGGSYPRLIHALGGHCWGPFQMDVTAEAIKEAHELGLKVVAWGYPEKEGTDFNAEQVGKLISWGIDGIITDRPDAMELFLKSRRQKQAD